MHRAFFVCVCNSLLLAIGPFLSGTLAAEELWVAKPFTPEKSFTPGIEGPNCDAAGNVFAVNYARQGTIGRVTPDGKGEVFVELPVFEGKQSLGNGIVFDPNGTMYVADYSNHNVLQIDPNTKKIRVFAHDDRFHQPNDLAIAPDGTFYCSDPDWAGGGGQLFHVSLKGAENKKAPEPQQLNNHQLFEGRQKQEADLIARARAERMLRSWRMSEEEIALLHRTTLVAQKLGTVNGIEVSPDGKTLYVNESQQLGVWAFPIQSDGGLGERKLVKQFPDHGFDGMRADVDGNLWISRYGKGTVVLLSPKGEILREVDVLGKQPSNVCLGGPDGRTVYVTEVEHARLVSFRVERPGLAWSRWPKGK